MTCPKCSGKTEVCDTYLREDSVLRRRRCRECGHVFRTLEVDEDYLTKMTERRKLNIT